MNAFGTNFRVSIFGASHDSKIGIAIDGCPAGLELQTSDFEPDISRRRPGGTGTTARIENDEPHIISGWYQGKTTGAPITLLFDNNNTRPQDYEAFKNVHRPGHADFVLHHKFGGFNDPRGGGHASGRLTLCLVAAGVIAKKVLKGIAIEAKLTEAGGISNIDAAIQRAIEKQDSIGGMVTCTVAGLPVGLGEPFFDSVESMISHAIFSIPAIKGIEFGSGFSAASMTGSEHNDAIIDEKGTTLSNHAGGINGGITNGNELYFRVAVKPTSSTPQEQQTWNHITGSMENFVVRGRHDLCIALRVPVVVEAVTAIVLADLIQRNHAAHYLI